MNWTPPDTRFAVTIDEIVEHAVGLICDQEEFDVISVLQDEVENALDDIAEAKAEKLGSKEVEKLDGRLKLLRKDLETATSIEIALRHELEKFKRDGSCALDVVFADKGADYPRFTKYSVYEWLCLNFNIIIADWAPPGAAHTHSGQPKGANQPAKAVGGKEGRKIREDRIASYHRVVQGLVLILMDNHPAYRDSAEVKAVSLLARDIHDALHHSPGEEAPNIETIEEKLLISIDESGSIKEGTYAAKQLILEYKSLVRGLVLLVIPLFRTPKYERDGKVNQSRLADEIIQTFDKRTKWELPSKRTIQRILAESNIGKIEIPEPK